VAVETGTRVAAGPETARGTPPVALQFLARLLRGSSATVQPATGPPYLLASVRAGTALVRRDLRTESARGTGFVVSAVLFGTGVAAYFALPAEPSSWLIGAFCILAIAACVLARPGTPRTAAAAALAVALGMASGLFETWRAGTAMTGSEVTTRLTGRIVAIEEREGGRTRITIDVLATERPELRYAPERVRVTSRAVPETLLPGATVTGVVRLLPPTGPVRPGGYDFSFRSYFDGIGANGFFLTGPFEAAAISPPGMAARIAGAIERFRERLADHIRGRIAGPEGEIAAALVAGVRGGIAEADNEALRRTGLAHFISISGLHMALVAAMVLVTLRGGFALFPTFASRHPVKKYAAAAALIAVCGYIVISGQEVAAVRSFIMAAVMLAAVLFDRAALTMRNLAISALIILVVTPHEVMGPSFQMSFGATAALIAAYAWHTQRRRSQGRRHETAAGPAVRTARGVLLFFGGLAATSIIAGLATTVFGVWHFQRVAPLGLVANLAAMPIVSAVVMPAALAGSLLIPIGLDAPFFAAMGWGLRLVMDIAHALSARSPLDAVGIMPATALLLLTVALVVATVSTTPTLRLLALPLVLAGLSATLMRDLPDVLVDEDGRLVAIVTRDGRLAVNRTRPSAFTLSNWSHATAASGIVRVAMAPASDGEQFACEAGLCVARHSSGAVIAHAADAASATAACSSAAVIVIDDATAGNPCDRRDRAVVITKRELALRGSVDIRFAEDGSIRQMRHAIGEAPRIWHAQRRYSREARGLPPWRRTEPASPLVENPTEATVAGDARQPGDQADERATGAAPGVSSAGSGRSGAPEP
jgi:ComEC/Rec2-related protein